MRLRDYHNILWIGAHPDDELSISALVNYTRIDDVIFNMVSVTAGESCEYNNEPKYIDFNCSAAYFGADNAKILYYRNLSTIDLKGKVEIDIINNWCNLEYDLQEIINDIKPDLIITIDPNVAFGGHLEHKVLFHFIKKALHNSEYSCEVWGSTSKLIWDDKSLSIVADENYFGSEPKHAKNIYRMHSCFSIETLSKLTMRQETGLKKLCYT